MQITESSFGIIPLCKTAASWKVLLVQHKQAKHWGFPKGHAEKDETPYQTACRELKEETHLDVSRLLHEQPLKEQYRFSVDKKRILKTVFYFVAEVRGELSLQTSEVENALWLFFPEAFEKLTYPEGKALLERTEKILEGF